MASDTVQQVKDRLSISDVVSHYVKLERAGSTLRARCPFHAEKTPSFFVSPERGTFHCFGCNEGGDIFTFTEKIEGLDFKGALKVLAEKAGVPLVFEKQEKKDERDRLYEIMEVATIFYISRLSREARQYLEARGVTSETIQEFRLGYAGGAWSELSDFLRDKKYTEVEIVEAGLAKKNERGSLLDKFRNRIMFPIADPAGRVVAFSGRLFLPPDSGATTKKDGEFEPPKYLNSPETPLFHKSRTLYGFDKAKVAMRKVSCAVLVEGQMDLVMSHQVGWSNTVAVSGTAFTDDHARLLKRMTDNLVLALDADQAGIKAAARAARAALSVGLNVKVARLPQGLDPADLLLQQGQDAWREAIRDAKDIITFLLDVLEESSPQKDRFRRSVETAVLPFLSEVQSPIALAQYIKEIAQRLDVRQEAVGEAYEKLSKTMPQQRDLDPVAPSIDNVPQKGDRAKRAYALFLWQQSQEKPTIDTDAFYAALSEAIGTEELHMLEHLPEAEKEQLRFSAERVLIMNATLKRDADELLRILKESRLKTLLSEATRALSGRDTTLSAEAEEQLEVKVKLYTEALAKMHEKR